MILGWVTAMSKYSLWIVPQRGNPYLKKGTPISKKGNPYLKEGTPFPKREPLSQTILIELLIYLVQNSE